MEGTMKAILHFTPDELVNEYIWISDGNDDSKEAELKALSSKVMVYAFSERQGLMRAKMKGVEMATAPVIVFLEAHVIPNKHWLQHILHRVVVNPKVLAMPVLDQIPQENWHKYYPMSPGHWRYEWNFNLVYTILGVKGNQTDFEMKEQSICLDLDIFQECFEIRFSQNHFVQLW